MVQLVMPSATNRVRAAWSPRALTKRRSFTAVYHHKASPERRVACYSGEPCGSSASRRQSGLLLASLLFAHAAGEAAVAATPTKVFVAGATGQTGSRVVAALRAQNINVVAGVRNPKKATAAGYDSDSGIAVRIADVTNPPEELAKAMEGCDAVVCATGGGAVTPFDDRAKKVDNLGTQHLVDAAKLSGISAFVLVSSLLTNAKAVGESKNPNYVVLQIFGGVLEEKLTAEKYLRKSGLKWTIVRPGGLTNDTPAESGNIIVGKEDSFLGRDSDPGIAISRTSVAEVCVQSLLQEAAQNRVVEIVASKSAPKVRVAELFSSL